MRRVGHRSGGYESCVVPQDGIFDWEDLPAIEENIVHQEGLA